MRESEVKQLFKKFMLKNSIRKHIKLIEEFEKKRYRSQSALVAAILTHETPSDEDVEYFNKYTEQIEKLRREIRAMQTQIDSV